jgi:hypothetical protein
MIHHALAIAKRGLEVFPCQPRSKEPATAHGVKNATTDRAMICSWWNTNPDFNIAVACGVRSGVFVLDVDDAENVLAELEAKHGALPPSVEAITAKGRHIFFKHPGPAHRIPNHVSKLGPGLDTRGDDGYVLVAPSIHPSGTPYAWSVDSTDTFAPAPQWLLELISEPASSFRTTPPEEWRALVHDGVAEGRRNQSAARLAGMLLRRGLDPLVVLDLVQCWNAMRCQPPLDEGEINGIVNSICKRELGRRAT